jgi:adenine-specific DNA-methyltransferase
MATNKQRLELTWIGKENRPQLEPRILLEDSTISYHAPHRVSEQDLFDNSLVYGDNLLALKALEQEFTGKVKCIFIDPPYNTGSAFEHYDDGLEHSLWLSMMRDRVELLRRLLADDGSLWIAIDDNEAHYLKVLCDEIFGRSNFVANIVWQSKDTPGNNAAGVAETHNHLLVFRRSELFQPNLLPRTDKQKANYSNPDDDPRGPWLAAPLTRVEHRDRDYYPLRNPAGRDVWPPAGSSWRRPPDTMRRLGEDARIWWGKSGNAEFPMEKKFLSEAKEGVTNQTWWPYEVGGSTRNASAEMKAIFGGTKAFDTPKPERLIQRVLEIATKPGDLVLDSFAGSGTTGAVAHKMRRRWIMVELGEHCETLIVPRLRRVIDGEESSGVTSAVGWNGGGGFRFHRLAPDDPPIRVN